MGHNEIERFHKKETEARSKYIKTLGIDLAKDVFQLHGANEHGKKVLSKRLNRGKLSEFIANLPPCKIGIEACTGSHYWARVFESHGHEVKMMAPQFVKPFVMSNKNDKNDAAVITEAMSRPLMRFVAHKTVAQQDILLAHRARELSMSSRNSQANQIRGLLADYGVVIPKGVSHIRALPVILDENKDKLSDGTIEDFKKLHEQFKFHEEQIDYFKQRIDKHVAHNERCEAILAIYPEKSTHN